MTAPNNIEAAKAAVLIMDYQNILINNFLEKDIAENVLENTAGLISLARSNRVKVIYVTVGFRQGYPEISPRNQLFLSMKEHGIFLQGTLEAEIHPRVVPLAEEPIIIKHRIGAFTYTDLDMLLRSHQIDTLILAGITTSGVVLSTVRQAFDLDYRLIVIRDCCADSDSDLHDILFRQVLNQHAEVFSLQEIKSVISFKRL